jgi:hypothetical protein
MPGSDNTSGCSSGLRVGAEGVEKKKISINRIEKKYKSL